MRARGKGVAVTALLLPCLAGCGQPHDRAVREVASTFYQAYADRDGAGACAQLAPETRSELEKSAGKPCPQAVLEEHIPQVRGTDLVRVFGTQAEVRWDADTTFLARFPEGWKVTAAACKPQPAQPYDCMISGG